MSAPGIKEPSRPGWATGFQGPTLQPHRPHHHHQPPWAAVNQCSTPPPPTCTHKLPNPAPLLQGTILSHPPPAPPIPKHGPHVNRATARRLPPPNPLLSQMGGGTHLTWTETGTASEKSIRAPTHPPTHPASHRHSDRHTDLGPGLEQTRDTNAPLGGGVWGCHRTHRGKAE